MNRLNVARCAVTMAVLLAGAFGAPVASAKSAPDSKSQIAFGVDMAKRGLWSGKGRPVSSAHISRSSEFA